MNPITLHCRSCRQIVLFSSDTARLRAYATEHHNRLPGHWLQAEITNPITNQRHCIDVPNRNIPLEHNT